jgi:hypothetical protein
MGRKPTVAKLIREKIAAKRRAASIYRNEAKVVAEQKYVFDGITLPQLDRLNFMHDGYRFTLHYMPENTEQAKELRAELGKLFNVKSWERKVNDCDGTVSYQAKFGEVGHRIVISNGELAEGCKVVEIVETVQRKRFKSVCGEQTQTA